MKLKKITPALIAITTLLATTAYANNSDKGSEKVATTTAKLKAIPVKTWKVKAWNEVSTIHASQHIDFETGGKEIVYSYCDAGYTVTAEAIAIDYTGMESQIRSYSLCVGARNVEYVTTVNDWIGWSNKARGLKFSLVIKTPSGQPYEERRWGWTRQDQVDNTYRVLTVKPYL